MASGEEEMRKSLEEILALYDIKMEPLTEDPSTEQAQRRGDYAEIISTAQQRLDDLTERAEAIYKRVGMTREQLEAYAANPANFTKEQWDALQRVKEACEKYKKEAHAWIGQEYGQKASSDKKEEKPKKHPFAKKKNWIPL